ncbi:histone H3, embryonic-like isoform X2 [Andrena cerasifolii]|uniref:histone H3, embryonic-like isoform X2 n=1 Tax=Andrena cerasifolii TaxID=2819439 RepID=UPI0040380635
MVRRKSEASSRDSTWRGEKCNTRVLVNRRRVVHREAPVLKEILYMRRSIKLLIPILPFTRLVREILMNLCAEENVNRLQASALQALQEAAEAYIIQFFEDCTLLSMQKKA